MAANYFSLNLYYGEIGNRESPQKFRQAKGAEAKNIWKIAALIAFIILLIAGSLFYRSRQTKVLSDKDTIVLADFNNTTGDPGSTAPCGKGSVRNWSNRRF